MPNHITNRITAPKEVIDFLLVDGKVDFNQLVPMPEPLSVQVHFALRKLLECDLDIPKKYEWETRETTLTYDTLSEADKKTYDKAKQNYEQYKQIDWYEWCLMNWGTKWNAYNTSRLSDTVVEFETAWSGIEGLIGKLSDKFPTHEIHYMYADEDIGSNVGKMTLLNGEYKEITNFSNLSKESFELAFELQPDAREYYELVNGTYEYVDDV